MIAKLILFQVLTFTAIIIALRFFFARNVNTALARLRELQTENQLIESKLKAKLEQAEKETEERLIKANSQAKKITDDAIAMGKILQRNQEDKGKIEVDKMLSDGREKVAKMQSELMLKINSFALKYATEIIHYLLSNEAKETLSSQLIDEVIEEIGKVDKERFSIKSNKVTVIANRELTDDQVTRLRTALFLKLDCNVEIQQDIDSNMLGGMVLNIEAFVINGSLLNRLDKVARMLGKNKKLINLE